MSRLEAIENKGYRVIVFASGRGALDKTDTRTIVGRSITDLYNKIVKK